LVADEAATRASAKSQRAGAAWRSLSRRSVAAIDGADAQWKIHRRKPSVARHDVQRPATTVPVAGSVRSGVA
jgi:hypothetical protein